MPRAHRGRRNRLVAAKQLQRAFQPCGRMQGYAVLGAECRASIADFTFAATSSVSRNVRPVVEMGSPIRISRAGT